MADNASSNLPSLTVLGGDKAGSRFVLDEPVDNILVGSDPSCRFCIALAGVSPVHARIWVDDTGITVYDTNSPRGLYVNDERVATQVRLRNGDVIWLGPPGDEQSVMIQCRVPAKEARPEPAAAPAVTDSAAPEPGATVPLVVPEGGFSAEAETVALPPAAATSTPLPPPASLLPPPAPPARNEFEDDMGEGTAPLPRGPAATQAPAAAPAPTATPTPAATPAPTATPAPVSAPPPARPQSLTPRPHTPPHVPPAPHPGMTPAPARPASLTPVPRSPGRPAGSRPAHAPAHAPQPRRAGRKVPIIAIGLVGLVVLGAAVAGGLFLFRERLARLVRATPSPEATATAPAVAVPTPAVTPVAETRPMVTPSAEATALQTPVEVVIPVKPSTPSPTATPAKTPTPTKTPTPAKTPSPPAAASAEALRAQQQTAQIGGLIAQAESAYASQRFEAAVGFYDEALRIDPREARATAGRQAATAAAFCWKRAFVPGRTAVKSAKGGSDSNLQGFESADVKVARAPDYSGLVEFVVSPVRVKPGDGYSVRVNLTNDGKKAFRITSASVTAVVNGEHSPVPTTPPTGEVAPRQASTLAQLGGSWPEGTHSWTLEVTVSTAHGETFSNQLSWR